MAITWQPPIPSIYRELTEPELRVRIQSAKDALGSRLTILGHHYQQDGIIDFADFVGDSFELSRKAAQQKGIEFVVFCGVHFMAESADILTEPSVRVILPDMGAGCSMADMANLEQTEDAWAQIHEVCGEGVRVVPITYMNSTAAIKAFVGEHGGAVCTSSNCRSVLEWALNSGIGGPPMSSIRETHYSTPLASHATIRVGANLPHWTLDNGIYSINFRLADSMPQSILREWMEERDQLLQTTLEPDAREAVQQAYRNRIEKYLDEGRGSCSLRDPKVAAVVAEALEYFNGERYRLVAWSIMPNHVHVLVQPIAQFTLSQILHTWKSRTAKVINQLLGKTGTFWQAESFDHLIRNDASLAEQIEYVWDNPTAAGLTDWKWKWRIDGNGESVTGSRADSAEHRRAADATSGTKILFFPDQHLGRNTAFAMGFPLDKMIVWDPRQDLGGNTAEQVRAADFILWKGHCSVHALFRPEHVDDVRKKYPQMKVIVHPECKFEVVQKADLAGSTAYIVEQIRKAPPGSQWAVGTEVHLINRLAREHPDQKIIVLSDCQCLCTTMYRIDLPHLCWVLENLVEGKVVNEIKVDDHTRKFATIALQRMLSIKADGNPIGKVQPATNVVD